MSFKLKMDNFKKVGMDKDSAIMQHKDGHEIKIALKSLSPKIRAQIHELPMHEARGGEQKQSNPKLEESKKVPHYSDGAEVKDPIAPKEVTEKWDEGVNRGTPAGGALSNLKEGIVNFFTPEPTPQPKPQKQAPTSFPDGGYVQSDDSSSADSSSSDQSTPDQAPQQSTQPTINIFNGQQPQASQMPAAPQAAGTDAIPQAQAQQPAVTPGGLEAPTPPPPVQQPQPQQPEQPSTMDQYVTAMKSGIGQQMKASEQAAAGTEKESAQQQALQQQASAQLQDQLNKDQEYRTIAQHHLADLNEAIVNGSIDPNKFLENKSVPQRIGLALSMLFSGAGSGVTGQPNLAMQFLNNQIDRDIAAQVKNQDIKSSLFNTNLQSLRDYNSARLVTRMQMNDIYGHMAEQYAAQNRSAQAEAAKNMFQGQLKAQNAFLFSQLKAPGTGAAGGGDPEAQKNQFLNFLDVTNPERAKDLRSRTIPGYSIGSNPIPNEARDKIIAKQTLDKMARDLYQWSQEHGGTILDRATVREGMAKSQDLQNTVRDAINGGVFKQSEQKFLGKIVNEDPTAFFNKIRVLPALKAVIDDNQNQLDTMTKGYGLVKHGGSSAQQAAPRQQIQFTPRR